MPAGTDSDADARAVTDDGDATDETLRAVLVTYERGPDRRTVYPDAADEFERMTHWLTADDDAFQPLDERR